MRRDALWNSINGQYIKTIKPTGYDVLINGENKYLNFNITSGDTGYGFRDNAGVMEVKNLLGTWSPFLGSSILEDYVPYTGADQDVNLGANYLQSNGLKNGSGSVTVDVLNAKTVDNAGQDSINYNLRLLYNNSGTQVLDWTGDTGHLKIGGAALGALMDIGSLTENRTFSFPDATGTLALTSYVDSKIQTIKVPLSSAQILDLFDTPVEVIPAGGAGTVIELISVVARLNYNTTTYTLAGEVFLSNPSSQSFSVKTIFEGAGNAIQSFNPKGTTIDLTSNEAITIQAQTSDPIDGDGTVDLYITYRVITL